MTQSQIAEEIGVSQMHVSRLLTSDARRSCGPRSRRTYRPGSAPAGQRCRSRALDAPRVRAGRRSRPGRRPRAAGGQDGRRPAAEVPGQAELDQLGQQRRVRAPSAGPWARPRRTASRNRAVRREEAAPWSAPMVSRPPVSDATSRTRQRDDDDALHRGQRRRHHERSGGVRGAASTTTSLGLVIRCDGGDLPRGLCYGPISCAVFGVRSCWGRSTRACPLTVTSRAPGLR